MPVSDTVRVIDPAWIPLADGTRLCARIWLPDSADSEPVPAILEYLPYRKDDAHAPSDATIHPYFAGHGYAAVRVDIRGSGDSDGVLRDEYSRQEHDDALEVIAWIAAQPWCTGAVGMTGISWSGFNSLQVAARRPPALKAIITACSTDDRYDNDVHYMGGVPLSYYLLPWASVMLAFNARPPDPQIVGERWRELWSERLEHNVDLSELWLAHQARDDYWRHGSICEDYGAIECAVLAVGGWADAYVDAIFRMLERLGCPRRAIVGPWGHQWPHEGSPGPAIGFLQEAVRWWDQWLKGVDRGVMDEPMLRAWMQDAVTPEGGAIERPGRWVAEPAWPPGDDTPSELRFMLGQRGLREPSATPEPDAGALSHRSPQTVGLDAGAWCAYGNPADLPGDQRRDDALSLSLDSSPLPERTELLGRPRLGLRVASDQPAAFVVARLCDVAPDGTSTLITRGVLNLCHHAGHDEPRALEPGVPVDVELALKSVAYALPAGHRIRLAISTSYWPWLWPSPVPATLTIATAGASRLGLPIRAPRAEDAQLRAFEPPVSPPPLPLVRLRDRAPEQTVTRDDIARTVEMHMRRNFAGAYRLPSGLEYDDDDPVRFTLHEDDPLSARVQCDRRIEIRRTGWNTRVEVHAEMSSDASDYHVESTVTAYDGTHRIHERTFSHTIPRRHT
jgi:putative CocE/NonD family hydrolase